jgi:hypothetical protein
MVSLCANALLELSDTISTINMPVTKRPVLTFDLTGTFGLIRKLAIVTHG